MENLIIGTGIVIGLIWLNNEAKKWSKKHEHKK